MERRNKLVLAGVLAGLLGIGTFYYVNKPNYTTLTGIVLSVGGYPATYGKASEFFVELQTDFGKRKFRYSSVAQELNKVIGEVENRIAKGHKPKNYGEEDSWSNDVKFFIDKVNPGDTVTLKLYKNLLNQIEKDKMSNIWDLESIISINGRSIK